MSRKLPPYFLKADSETRCIKCDKVRGICRFCECCHPCCQCCPQFICPHCHKAEVGAVQAGSDMARELEGWCECEPCPGCGKNIMYRDIGNYFDNDTRPWCVDCYKKRIKR